MDKLEWFKFSPSSWMMGRIMRQPDSVQASFTRLCCVYWNKACIMTQEDARITCGESFEALTTAKIVKFHENNIVISFLDEQMEEIIKTSKKNRANALERWNKEKGNNTTELQTNTTSMRPHATASENNASNIPNDTDKTRQDKEEIRTDVDGEKPAPPTTTEIVSVEEKKQTPSEWLKELKPTVYINKYRNHGHPMEKIEAELALFDGHHADTLFVNVDHCLNVWGKWCAGIREHEIQAQEAKKGQFNTWSEKQVPSYTISKISDKDAK